MDDFHFKWASGRRLFLQLATILHVFYGSQLLKTLKCLSNALLQIYSQNDTYGPLEFQAAVCGAGLPPFLAIRGYRVDLDFSSNAKNTAQGYNISYRVVVPSTEGTYISCHCYFNFLTFVYTCMFNNFDYQLRAYQFRAAT